MPDAEGTGTASEVRYKVGEVCRLADVQPYVLRYWENEFPVLAADRSQPGPRMYSERDLAVIQRIKTLLYVEGFTIAGAKKRLEAEMRAGQGDSGAQPAVAAPPPVPQPPPQPPREAQAAEPKSRRTKTRPVSVPKNDEPELPEVFEETVGDEGEAAGESAEAANATGAAANAKAKEVRTGVVTPPAKDPRLPRIVAELKQILEMLSRES